MKTSAIFFHVLSLTFLMLACLFSAAPAQTTAFTYQGRLNDGATAANGTYDFQFGLYTLASGGSQIGTDQTVSAVAVSTGIFTVQLNFGSSPFAAGADRYLEIRVKKPADGSYTTLAPRQQIASSPYSVKTLSAGSADSLSAACAGCVTDANVASGIAYSKLSGAPASLPPSGAAGGDLTGSYPNPTIANSAVTSAKILDGTIVNADISTTAAIDGAKVAGGNITNLNASNLATGTVPVGRLGTNTPTAATFLRGDNTWATPAGGGSGVTLQVAATKSTAQAIATSATANISFETIATAPTAGTFDGTTFTAAAGGTYLVTMSVGVVSGSVAAVYPSIQVNGTTVALTAGAVSSALPTNIGRGNISMILTLAAGNTVVIQGTNSSAANVANLSTDGTTRLAIAKLN